MRFFTTLCVALGAPAHAALLRRNAPAKSEDQAPYRQELTNFMDTQYYGELTVGGQSMLGIFDTGSFELMVLSKRCKECKRYSYDPQLSHSYVKEGTIQRHVFGSGPVVTLKGYEDVVVGNMKAKHLNFWEIIEHQIPVFDHSKFSAIVGIGVTYAPQSKDKTMLMEFGIAQFAVCLEPRRAAPGWLIWGKTSNNANMHMFRSIPVVGQVHWGVEMKKASFKGTDNLCPRGCGAIVDSGTSLIAAPGLHLQRLAPVLNLIEEDCSNLNQLPNLELKLGDLDVVLPPSAYVMKVVESSVEAPATIWEALFTKPKVKREVACIPAFMQLDKMSQFGPVWILGMPFLRHYYTEFDRSEKVIRVARATKDCSFKDFNSPSLIQMEDEVPVVDVNALLQPWNDRLEDDAVL